MILRCGERAFQAVCTQENSEAVPDAQRRAEFTRVEMVGGSRGLGLRGIRVAGWAHIWIMDMPT